MKYSIVTTLAAALLLAGCFRPPEDGGGGSSDQRFILEFAPVRSVTVDDWRVPPPQPLSNTAGGTSGGNIPTEPPVPPTFASTVRIEGVGTVQTPWTYSTGVAYQVALQRGNISLSYRFAIDNGCKATAEQAQREGRSLIVEGFGTVAELAVAMGCDPIPVDGGGSAGGGTGTVDGGTVNAGTAQPALAIACPPPPGPVGPPTPAGSTQSDPSTDPGQSPYYCWCQPPLNSFLVKAEKLVSCSLGGNVILPPAPAQPEPQPL